MLTPEEIVNLGGDHLANAQDLLAALGKQIEKLDVHHADPKAKPVSVAALSVARGSMITVVEQLAKHVRENTPKPPVAADVSPLQPSPSAPSAPAKPAPRAAAPPAN